MITDQAERFVDGVLSGEVPACRMVKYAAERHRLDLERSHLTYDLDKANRAGAFFGHLVLTTGEYAGQRMKLRDWQAFVVASLFGWLREDGTRRFRDCLISVARGNGKSPFAAALAIKLAFLDGEARAEGFCFATKRDQAKIVWDEAYRLLERSSLAGKFDMRVNVINDPRNYSTLRPLGSDSKNTDGLIPHVCILDELHEWRDHHRGLHDKIITAMGKRRQPMMVKITTAGDDYSEIWKEQQDYSRRVLEQTITQPKAWIGDDHFAFICEIDKDDDVWDEGNWLHANPMLLERDSPVKIDHLRSMAAKARGGDLFAEQRFRRYHCNQLTSGIDQPFHAAVWAKGQQEVPELTKADTCYIGVDLARSNDWAAVSMVQPVDDDYAIRTWAWTVKEPGEDLAASLELATLRRNAANLFVLPGGIINFGVIRDFVIDLTRKAQVKAIAYDAAYATEFGQILQEEYGLPMVICPQSAKAYNEPICRFLQYLLDGHIRHGNCPLFAWQAGNLKINEKNVHGYKMPDKSHQAYKIDSMVAMLMAFREAITTADSVLTYYEDHPVIMF